MSSPTPLEFPSGAAPAPPEPPKPRTIVYIDGFNLYFGIRDQGWRKYYWLDMPVFAADLSGPRRDLIVTKYFTSRISGSRSTDSREAAVRANAKQRRQTRYLDALASRDGLNIQYGQYLGSPAQCLKCGVKWIKNEEKMTDVNIATSILTDAFQDAFDVAILVSGDSDLVPPIRSVRELFPHKHVVVAFPPNRVSTALMKIASSNFHINESSLRNSQLPDPVVVRGFAIVRPDEWK